MKKILVFGLTFLGISFASIAQEQVDSVKNTKGKKHPRSEFVNKTPEELAQMKTNRLDKELKFTEAQKKEVYALNLKTAQEQKLRFEQRKKEMEARKQDLRASREYLLKILTPEQKELMKNKIANDKGPGFRKRGHGERRRNFDRKERESKEVVSEETTESLQS
ncbi:hypothetical protein [Sphingobacterium hungaricum]